MRWHVWQEGFYFHSLWTQLGNSTVRNLLSHAIVLTFGEKRKKTGLIRRQVGLRGALTWRGEQLTSSNRENVLSLDLTVDFSQWPGFLSYSEWNREWCYNTKEETCPGPVLIERTFIMRPVEWIKDCDPLQQREVQIGCAWADLFETLHLWTGSELSSPLKF